MNQLFGEWIRMVIIEFDNEVKWTFAYDLHRQIL